MSGTRCGFVALVGAPNAGKSTLLNALVGAKLSIVTHKVQTTRARLRGIAVEGDSQIVFVDTPGIFKPKRRLERAMVDAAWGGARDADVVVLLYDAHRRRLDEDRLRPALPHERERPFQSARAEVGVERGDDEHRVHVRRDDLRVGPAARHLADERAAPRKHVPDRGRAFRRTSGGSDPVTDGREIFGRSDRAVTQRAGDGRTELSVWAVDAASVPVLGDHTRRNETGSLEFIESGLERRVPAEALK